MADRDDRVTPSVVVPPGQTLPYPTDGLRNRRGDTSSTSRGGESATQAAADTPAAANNSETTKEAGGSFECNVCFETPMDAVVTPCGHLYCWGCMYEVQTNRHLYASFSLRGGS